MIVYIILSIFLYIFYRLYNYLKCPKEWQHIPAVPILSFLNFQLSKDPFNDKMKQQLQPLLDKYGVIRVFNIQGWTLLIGDPKLTKEVFMRPDIFGKQRRDKENHYMNTNMLKFFGKRTVGGTNGEEWKKHRKVMNPIFHKTWSTELFGNCAKELIEGWEKMDKKDIHVHDLIQRMTLDVLGQAIFDIDFKSVKDPSSKLYHLYNSLTEQLFNQMIYLVFPFLEFIPFIKRTKLSRQIDEYNQFVENIIKLRKQEMKDPKFQDTDNLINALIKSNDNTEGSKLTEEEIRDNIKTFILAGHDTTSNTLSSTLYYLARYPEIQDKLRSEILSALDFPNQLTIPTIDQLKKIPYMDLVNKESMRIMTTATAVQRLTTDNYTLSNGIFVPKRSHVIVHLWAAHHNSQVYQNPDQFDPERFADLSSDQSRNWQPFIVGPRSCIGTSFSMMEQRVTIAMILQKFELSISNNNPDYHKLRLCPNGIMRPNDLQISFTSRF